MIKTYFYLVSLFAMLFINIAVQAQKIEGAGIPPSKVQAYSGESAQYTVSGLDGRLTWDVTYGHAGSPFGFSQTEITWGVTTEGKIIVRSDNGKSVEATVQVAPLAPEFRGLLFSSEHILVFSDVKDCSYYQWTIPSGCTTSGEKSGTFREKKELFLEQENAILRVIVSSPKQLYYEGDVKVQAISDKNSLLSRTTTYKYKTLDVSYLKLIESPDIIDYGNQKTYIIAVENIAGATYKWSIDNGTIISGQNTNRIVVKPNNPLWTFGYKLDFTYQGFTKTKKMSSPVRMNIYIDGPTDVYGGIVEYTFKSPYTEVTDNHLFSWKLDNFLTYFALRKYTINTDTLSTGVHYLSGRIGSEEAAPIKINKHSNKLYTINNYSNNLTISRNETNNTSLLKSNNSSLIQIFDQRGILVLKKEMPSHLNQLEINLDGIKSGIYFVNVIDENDITKQKIIIK